MAISPQQTLAEVELDASPAQVAQGLRHLPGMVFLDSSRSEYSSDSGRNESFSVIAANPTETISGNIFDLSDRRSLRNLWQKYRIDSSPDLGFPMGGLIGSIDYDGAFHFGSYPEMLIHDRAEDRWLELGSPSRDWDCGSLVPEPPPVNFESSVTRERFCEMVQAAKEYIAAGDIYQVNLSHRFRSKWPEGADPFSIYLNLREASPAPFSAYLDLGGRRVLSSSPEQFLRISGRTIQTRPIKGTRPRFRDRERDEKSAYDLITSPKEISELIMITDLERNDIGQICEFGSVEATELLKLERYAQVFHLVSTVEGTLREEVDHIDAVHACFPGGSITGAPKKRAREIIDELETLPRGLYTGAIGCFGFNGESRFNIAIRTAIEEMNTLHFHVGAGIVADSIPEMEWEETLHKASGIFRACGVS